MTSVGQLERRTQQRVVKLFREPLDYRYLGNWEGETENLEKYNTYRQMLADWFSEPPEKAISKIETFEKEVKKKFIDEPGQMKLLIVVDKLLTGFDAPSATYLYIDKQMRDHGLFQAICRVNRLDGDDKEYGYIIDYKDLFKSLEQSVHDYTSGAFDNFDREDVAGLLEDRLEKARERLEEAREAVKAICEPVDPPKDTAAYIRYFCAKDSSNRNELKDNEPNRLALYKHVAALIRAYANLANELAVAKYHQQEIAALKREVDHYEKARTEVKLASGDYIDLKMYEPAMRHLIDAYIRAEESQKLSAFDDLSLIELIVRRGPAAIKALPKDIAENKEAAAETIENNVRKLIIDESPINPRYYEKMSELLDELIKMRRTGAIAYKEYLDKITELTRKLKNPAAGGAYPAAMNSPARRALYDNFGKIEAFAIQIDDAVRQFRQDDWRTNIFKVRKLRNAIGDAVRMYKQKGGVLPAPILQEPNGAVASSQQNPEEALINDILDLIKKNSMSIDTTSTPRLHHPVREAAQTSCLLYRTLAVCQAPAPRGAHDSSAKRLMPPTSSAHESQPDCSRLSGPDHATGGRQFPPGKSQRDCSYQPRVARNELPWVTQYTHPNPEKVRSRNTTGAQRKR